MSAVLIRLIFASLSVWEMSRACWSVKRNHNVEAGFRTGAAFGFAGMVAL